MNLAKKANGTAWNYCKYQIQCLFINLLFYLSWYCINLSTNKSNDYHKSVVSCNSLKYGCFNAALAEILLAGS